MTTITALPTPVPQRSDPTNFAPRADLFLAALPTFATETNLVASEVNTNASTASSQAGIAVSAANAARDAAAQALAAANFKGEWFTLAGALNKPACVKHNGRFWLLLNNLTNVATSQPGVSADWTSIDAGTPITQAITSNTTAVVGVRYIIAASTLTLTLPTTGLLKGDYIGIRLAVDPSPTQIVDFGSVKLLGQTAGQVYMDAKGFMIDLNYENSTYGWN